MPLTLDEFRKKYPAYDGVDDATLADALYKKYYAGKIDRAEFNTQLGLAAGGAPEAEGRPSLAERFRKHVGEGFYQGTLTGSGYLSGPADALGFAYDPLNPGGPMILPSTPQSRELFQGIQRSRREGELQRMRAYEAMPDAQTFPERAAAVAGELVGGAASPENLILPEGGQIYRQARRFAGPLISRLLTRGAQVAGVNVATDPLVQAQRMEAGVQENFDPWRVAISGALGFGIGVGGSTLAQTVRGIRQTLARSRGVSEEQVSPETITPEEWNSPEVKAVLEASGIVNPADNPRMAAEAAARLQRRGEDLMARRTIVQQATTGTPSAESEAAQGVRTLDQIRERRRGEGPAMPEGADVQAALREQPDVIRVGPGGVAAAEGATENAPERGVVESLRQQFSPERQIADLVARIGEDPEKLVARQLSIEPAQFRAMSMDAKERVVAAAQRQRAAERPAESTFRTTDEALSQGEARYSPASRPQPSAVRRPPYGQAENLGRAENPTETDLGAGGRRYSRTSAGAGDRPFKAEDTGGPTPEQARGFEDTARERTAEARKASEEDLVNRWRAYERARTTSGESADAGARRYYENTDHKYSNAAKKPGEDGRFATDKYGYVASTKGGPIRFADQKQAAKWIVNVGHKKSLDQVFEIYNHPSGKGFTVRERGRSESPGSAGAGEAGAAGRGRPGGGEGSRAEAAGTRELPPPSDTGGEGRQSARPGGNNGGRGSEVRGNAGRGGGVRGEQERSVVHETPAGRGETAGSARRSADTQAAASRETGSGAGEGGAARVAPDGIPVAEPFREAVANASRADLEAHRAELVRDQEAARESPSSNYRPGYEDAHAQAHIDVIDRRLAEMDKETGNATARGQEQAGVQRERERTDGELEGKQADRQQQEAEQGQRAEAGAGDRVPRKKGKPLSTPENPPRTQAQLEGRLDRADRARNRPELTAEQKRQAKEVRDKAVSEIQSKAHGTHAAWREASDAARDAAAEKYGGGKYSDAERFKRGWDNNITNDPHVTRGDDEYAGSQAARSWKKGHPEPHGGKFVTVETVSGRGKTDYFIEGNPDEILKLAERVNKLDLTTFYSNPLDPKLLKDLFGPLFGKEAGRWADEVGELLRDFAGASARAPARGFADYARTLVLYNDAIIRHQAYRFAEPDGTPNKAIIELADMFHAAPGRNDEKAVAQTYGEAVDARAQRYLVKLAKLLKPFEEYRLNEQRAVLEQISRLIIADKVRPGTSRVHNVAAEVQNMLRDWLEYAHEAGLEMGDVGRKYFPRELAIEEVLKNPRRFIEKAKEAYRADGLDARQAEDAAQAWLRRIEESDLGFRSDGNDFHTTSPSQGTRNEKGRVLSAKADKIMEDFYLKSVADVLPQYFIRLARRAEWVRRMGANLEKWEDIKGRIVDSGAGEAIPDIVRALQSAMGTIAAPRGNAPRAALSILRTIGVTQFLPRATLSSLAEPVITATRSGRATDAINSYIFTLRDMVREISGIKDPKSRVTMAREMAEDLGLLSSVGDDLLMAQRFGGQVDNKIARKITNQFFVRTGLHHFTEGTRVAATSIGQVFIRRLARSIDKDNVFSRSSRYLMKELGIEDVEGFSKWVLQFKNGMPTAEDLAAANSGNAKLYRDGLYRFVSQSIMKPTGIEKARYANHPVGALFYHLQSFNYAFQVNVLNRYARLGKAAFRGKGMNVADRMRLMAPLAWFLSIAIPMQFGIGELRDIYQKDPGLDPQFGEQEPWEKILRAFSRAGMGVMDLPANLALSLKFSKAPAEAALGPVIGALNAGTGAVLNLISDENSPDTNTAERSAMKYGWETLIKPMLISALSLMPGKVGAMLAVPGIQYVALPKTREKVLRSAVGEPEWLRRNRAAHGAPKRPRIPKQPKR